MADEIESIEQEVDLTVLANTEDETSQEEQQEESQLSDFEQKQYDEGWRPLDDFNGAEENWKTAKEFANDGKWIAKLNDVNRKLDTQQQDFNARIDNVNKYNTAQTEAKISALKAEQRNAVDVADTDAYDSAQTKIEALEKETVQPKAADDQPGKDPLITTWENKNEWFNDPTDERGTVAVGVWNAFCNKNPTASVADALSHVDKRIERLYPTDNTNARRNQPNAVENNSRRSGRKSKTITMNDLTPSERTEWSQFGSQMFTEAEFLKTVTDTRGK